MEFNKATFLDCPEIVVTVLCVLIANNYLVNPWNLSAMVSFGGRGWNWNRICWRHLFKSS